MLPAVQAVIDYLRRQWDKPLRLTSVGAGLEAHGLGERHDLRLQIAEHLAAQAELYPVVGRWGVPTLVLEEDEKLLGRRLVQLRPDLPVSAEQLSADIGVAADQLELGLGMLQHLQLISWRWQAGRVSYLLEPGYSDRLGPLSFNFHGVRLESRERFNVPCAFDYLLLAGSELAGERVEISDSCVHCTARIRAVITRGRRLEAEPTGTLLFRGGG